MALDFIPPTIEGYNMITMTKVEEKIEWTLTPKDRCDACSAEALVKVTGLNGELLFCGHHYNKIMDSSSGYKKMMQFAINIVDEREKLVENKAKGESY
jgi:hypothetical protein